MTQPLTIRPAQPTDAAVIVDFNCRLAAETEDKTLDRDIVSRGVAAALADPAKAQYLLACIGDRVIGQLMHTWEWSDWRNGYFWWLQSVYVDPEFRGRGVFRRLFESVRETAAQAPDVVGLRLYVENANSPAQAVYGSLGMHDAGYRVMELPVERERQVLPS